jgi:predicted RNA-binding protein associated with RNAse of E/G family
MPRHPGALIDLSARTIRIRTRDVQPFDRCQLSDGALYVGFTLDWSRRFSYIEQWLIPASGWVINRFTMRPDAQPFPADWYIDIDHIEVEGNTWRVDDRFLDVIIHEGRGYEVLDADELADAIEQHEIETREVIGALRALHVLCDQLPRLGFSGPALLETYAPGLPR